MRKNLKKVFQKIRVPSGFILAVIFIIFCKPDIKSILSGLPVIASGLILRVWAAGHIRKGKEVTSSGPYRFTRNPLYLGSFLLCFGVSIQSGRLFLVILLSLLFIIFYYPVMLAESEELKTVFGNSYIDYAKEVPLFFPYKPVKKISNKKFQFEQYIANREYQAFIGTLIVEVILVIKLFYPFL